MHQFNLSKALYLLLACALFFFSSVSAYSDEFSVGHSLSDGKDGRPLLEWKTTLRESPIVQVKAVVRKQSGPKTTSIKLILGESGEMSSPNDVLPDQTQPFMISWKFDNEMPRGRKLILHASGGYVFLEKVIVNFADGQSVPQPAGSSATSSEQSSSANTISSPSDMFPDRIPPRYTSRYGSSGTEKQTVEYCNTHKVDMPEIEIYNISPLGLFFSREYLIQGYVRGQCIKEMSYYENGKKISDLKVTFDDTLSRERFELQVLRYQQGEIRITLYDGRSQRGLIDHLIEKTSLARTIRKAVR